MKHPVPWIGCGSFLLSYLLFTAVVINPMRLGGTAWGGKEEDGRYFVVSAGHRYSEVTEIEWRIEKYLEWCFFLPIVLVCIGIAVHASPAVPDRTSAPPPADPPMWIPFASLGITALGAGAGWCLGGEPWTAVLGAWLALSFGVLALVGLHSRLSRRQLNGEAPAAATADCPDANDTVTPSSESAC